MPEGIFDTHCHFEGCDGETIGAIMARARAAGVSRLMAVGGSPELNVSAVAAWRYAAAHRDVCPETFCTIGFDRDQIGLEHREIPDDVDFAAWGEIGLDYHYSPGNREEQMDFFAAQLEEAGRRNLPVSVHTRDADDDTLGILREIPSRGVIHCFTGTPDFACRLLDLGFYISISGIVTFKSAGNVRESALAVPDDRLLVETDAPFLAPVPMRGKPNEPAFITYTCAFLADLRHTDAARLAETTAANALAMLSSPCA